MEGAVEMRMLALCAALSGLGILVFIGILAIARDLFSDSLYGVPSTPDKKDDPAVVGEEHFHSSSARSIR